MGKENKKRPRNLKANRSKRISLGRELYKPRLRILIAGLMIVLLFVAVSIKAFELQVLDREKALRIAMSQHRGFFTLLPRRGKILDSNNKELAVNLEAYSIYLRPKEVKEPRKLVDVLSKHLGLTRDEVLNLVSSKKPFVWVKRLVEPDVASKIKEMNIGGIGFIEEPKRIYPNGHLAGQVLGFTDIDSRGIEGVEYYLDEVLAGKPGKVVVKKDARGRQILSEPFDFGTEESISGADVILTLNSQIQYIVERELKEGVERVKAEKGMVVVMNPETGEVIAMASYPFLDPNNFKRYGDEVRRNLTVWYSFEPGSTIKPFLVAAALEEGVVSPSTMFDCENGRRRISGAVIRDVHPYKVLSVSDTLRLSSNICASKIAEALGKDRFYKYLEGFGFGQKTGIDLPGESSGIVTKPKQWGPVELATLSFGQGISVTVLQLATALSAIANGGYLIKPYIVKKVMDPEGNVLKENEAEVRRRVISYETARKVTEMLEAVVEDGTGKNALVPGYRVAGKTGTAQVPNPQTGGYYSDRHISSFIGFAPSDDPRITVVVVVVNPKTSFYGGVVAAPIFKEIVEKSLFYLGVPPQKGFAEAKIMPDLRGMSAREILRWAEKEGVKVRLKGSGYAKNQKPGAGEKITEETVCLIELEQKI